MPRFLLETYEDQPRETPPGLPDLEPLATLIRTIRVPGDQVCFHLVDAPTAAAVEMAARRQGLRLLRVAEAIDETSAPPPTPAERAE